MKKVFITLALFFPTFCGAAQPSIEFELVRTPETPGFFAITIFPSDEAAPLLQPILFVKNFKPSETKIYSPIVDFLTELGASVSDHPENNFRIITLGTPLPGSQNFSSHDASKSLEQFEAFSLQNLKPVFLRNLKAEFGGNISDVFRSKEGILDEKGITFIGKFEKDIRTRMVLSADDENSTLYFETPLDLTDTTQSHSPIANALPQLWEQLSLQNTPLHNEFSLFPWIVGAIGLWVVWMVLFLGNRKYHRYQESKNRQTEFPWHTVSAKDDRPSQPFEVS